MLKMPKIKTSNNAPMALAYVITLSKALNRSAFLACTFLLILGFNILFPFYKDSRPEEVSATTTTENLTPGDTSISITADSSIVLPLIPNSSYGTFSSTTSTFTVAATNPGGYTLSLATRSNSGEDTTSLVNQDDTTSKFTTISGTVSTTAFSQDNATGAALNGKWGYKYYKGTDSSSDNGNFNEMTADSAISLDSVNTAATNTYTIGIGARAGLDLPAGTYSNTFVLTATANPISYTFNLKLNDGTANNFYTQVGSTYGTVASIYATAPTRDGYEFKGWCSTTTSDDTCSGTTYQPGAEYTIDTSSTSSTTDFYAMWKQNLQYMQDVLNWGSTVAEGTSVQAVDNRDGKKYWVTRLADGKLWMTQNLDLDLGGKDQNGNDIVLTSENTNLKVYNSGGYTVANGYSQDSTTGMITWTPARHTILTSGAISGWSNSSTAPYSVDPGDWYWGNDPFYASTECNYLSGCTDKFQKDIPYDSNGEHGHVGNYYNWSAAIASNNSSDYSSNTLTNIDNNPKNSICPKGWRLPTIYTSATTDDIRNEFYYLINKYNAYITSGSERDKMITSDPIYFIRGGFVFSSQLYSSGKEGSYWSSTVKASDYASSLYFYDKLLNAASDSTRGFGRQIRCVAEADGTMQGFTSEDFGNMAIGKSKTLVDTRSDTTYEVKMLELNGTKTLWMMSNLQLPAGTTLTSSDSNVTSNFTLPTTSWTSSSQNYYCRPIMAVKNSEYYYNWYAATANPTQCSSPTSSTNATAENDAKSLGDICPKGWRLPIYAEVYNGTWRSNVKSNGSLSTTGRFDSGSQSRVGSVGYWWTSARENNGNGSAHFLDLSGSLAEWNYGYKYFGLSVRCLRTS